MQPDLHATVGAGVPALDRRIPLAHLPTPLEPADRLGAALGLARGDLWVKRDDATGLAGGGNKARKLEYLCAEAVAEGCDTLVTGGGPQSNHVRMTAAAANRLGLECTLVVAGDPESPRTGNLLLNELLEADMVWVENFDYYAIETAIDAECHRLRREGHRPYPMPIGGASSVGALGYVRGGLELLSQAPNLDVVVTADGSGGTHAGLAAALGDHRRVLGIDVGARPDLDQQVPAKAVDVAALAGVPAPVEACQIDHQHIGERYGAPTAACRQALALAARTEGLLLDPVYTGKAMAGLVAACRDGRIKPGTQVVFLHTGGLPALFSSAYTGWIRRR